MSQREYDVIVIGAGNGGLAAASYLAHQGTKVLCLEKHNIPGGFATSFVRGRFEFEATLHVVAEVGTSEQPGSLRKDFKEIGITGLNWIPIPEAFHIISKEDDIDFVMPFGIENVVNAVEEYYPGSYDSLKQYLDLCGEVSDAIEYITESKGNVDKKFMLKTFPNFLRTAPYSMKQVLDTLKIPTHVRNLFQGFWAYLGVPTDQLNWAIWAMMVYSLISKKGYIPSLRSTQLALMLSNKIQQSGGEIECNSEVTTILLEGQHVKGVETIHGEKIRCKQIISDASPTLIYNYMIPHDKVPVQAFQNINSRKVSYGGFVVFLGLNKSADELGIQSYSYMSSKSTDTKQIFNSFNSLTPDLSASMCLNRAIPTSSPDGTCMLTLTTLSSPIPWKNTTAEEYFVKKRMLTKNLISDFESITNISISPHIEEIEASSPLTYARYFNSFQGSIYGYTLGRWDHTLSRMMMIRDEEYIKGLTFAGAHAMNQAFNSSFMSGFTRAKMVHSILNQQEEK